MNDQKIIWALVGCMGVFVLLLCAGGLTGAVMFYARGAESVPVPVGPGGPTNPPLPFPQPPSLPNALPVDLSPREVQAEVTAVTGSAPVAVGTQCRFVVDGRDRSEGGYWCNAQIVCDGRLLYGGPQAGFFPCDLSDPSRHVSGGDAMTTSEDTDASMQIDTARGSLTIRDDANGSYGAYSLTAQIHSVR